MLPFGSIKIGKIFGIDIEINYTWFVIFVLILASFIYTFNAKPFKLPLWVSIADGTIATFLFFGSVLFHELSHSLVARKNKLPIKKITLFIFGGVAQMSEEPTSAAIEFKMAIAGPLSSVFLGLVFGGISLASYMLKMGAAIYAPFLYLGGFNLALVFFNLLPGFPLDGGRVLRATIWYLTDDFERATRISSRAGQVIAYLLVFVGLVGALSGGGIQLLWIALLGWFLNQAAITSYQQLMLQQALSGHKVSEIMSKEVLTVKPTITLDTLVNEYFLRYKFGRFPVTLRDELLGVITLHDIKEVPREKWHEIQVKDIVTPLPKDAVITLDEDAAKALMKMAKADIGHLLVTDEGRLVGLVTKSDIIRLIKVKTELGV